jgi:hypothetical protein
MEREELIGREITDVLDAARDAGPLASTIDLREGTAQRA